MWEASVVEILWDHIYSCKKNIQETEMSYADICMSEKLGEEIGVQQCRYT